jgi:glycosyltransferase involved in cell wall biosynthesis
MSDPGKYTNIFVVIPAFNESSAIRAVVQDVLSHGYTPVIVDDGSSEDIFSPVRDLPVWYLQHPVNLGQGAALQTGIEFAVEKGAELIVSFDADGQHQAKDIALLTETIRKEGADIVLGSRFMKGAGHNMSSKRKFLLQLARYINFFFTGLLLTDAHNGLRVLTSLAAGKLPITENGMSHATELLSSIRKKQLKYKEAPVTVVYTDYSRQKGQTLWSGFRIFFDILLSKIFK